MIKVLRTALCVALLSAGMAMPQASAAPLPDMGQLSQQLIKMESPAEDMLDAIDHKDMLKLGDLYHELDASMTRLNQAYAAGHAGDDQTRQIGLQNSWFDLIALEMKEMDDLPALANAINQFSGQLIVTTHFTHDYQKNIAWMDYLGREFLLMNKYSSDSPNHAALARARKAELESTWHVVRIAIGKRAAGVAVINKVDPVIHALLTESQADKLVVLSKKELDLVDNIEAYFHID